VLHEGGRKLGILRGGTLVFDTEDQTSVLMDYCIYDVRRNGRNAVEDHLLTIPPDSESEELNCLRSMQCANYSLFTVESVERGLGVAVRDLRTDESLFVVDIGFGSSLQPELVFASRLIPQDGFWTTGGAALPVGAFPADDRGDMRKQLLAFIAPNPNGYFDPARLIRACLEAEASSHIEYGELGQRRDEERWSDGRRPRKIGRNVPCPCGSGRKFKHCCLNRI
jgi:hypothetical protein